MAGRILVVDDTPSNLRLLMNLLTQQGYTVHPATNGQAALRFLDITLPDLILLDAVMPGMDGYQVAERLKANERTREIPLIFISAASQPLDKMKAFGCGAVDYIVKPFQAEEVLARIATHLALRQLQKNLEQRVEERTAELQAANARLRRLVESDIIGVCFWDLDRGITEANDAFLDMIGYGRQELLAGSLGWSTITPPEFAGADQRAIDEARQKGRCTPYEKDLLKQDGTRIPVLVGAAMFEASSREGVAFVLDLSERRRAEAERQARVAAELANRAKSTFLASMTHELRTPLNAILGYAQILKRDGGLSERQLAGLNTIQQSGEHLLALINDILDLSRIEAGRVELHPEAVVLATFLRVVTDIVRIKAELKGLAFIHEAAPDLPRAVRVDPQRLRQVLLNLLSNAVKFTDRGEVSLRVLRLRGSSTEARLRFTVQDTGPGIDPAQQEVIFLPFEQVGEVGRRFGGTGLGLAISRQLVRQMGSDIKVHSRPGQGSRFWFDVSLPLATAAEEAGPAPIERPIAGYRGPRRQVLVIDDVEANRAMLADLLKQAGFEVAQAASGQEGLARLQAGPPDLVVLDIMMPGLDGLEIARRIRQMPDLQALPIIAVSASAAPEDRNRSLAAGASAFIAKPIAPARILEEIGAQLGLAWEYEAVPEPAAARSEETELVAPPREEMAVLHHLARTGSMRDICGQADHLANLDERYRPFAERLRELAGSYQSKAILALVGKYMHGNR